MYLFSDTVVCAFSEAAFGEILAWIRCPKTPRIGSQTHVKKIVEIAPLKEGSGKELRYLHDTAQQHLRALKAMGHEPSGSLVTSLLELKLDQNTMFEWQKCSQESSEVPHYKDLLEFINLRAQASESVSSEIKKFIRTENHLDPNEVRQVNLVQ